MAPIKLGASLEERKKMCIRDRDSLMRSDKKLKLIVMGDMNDDPMAESMEVLDVYKRQQELRSLVAKMKLITNRAMLEGKRLLFCDDSIVRGTQLHDNVKVLYEYGAKAVSYTHLQFLPPAGAPGRVVQ